MHDKSLRGVFTYILTYTMLVPLFDPHIFRAYDIRGKARTQLSESACFWIGKAFGTELKERYGEHPTVVLGRDARTHGPMLEAKVAEGLVSVGCHVKAIGETPSPVNYFTICTGKFDGGIHVTASHNPKEDNGLKLQLRDAHAFAGEDIQRLRLRIEDEYITKGDGSFVIHDALTPYSKHLTKLFSGVGKGKKVIVDTGNGVAGPAYCDILKRVGADVIGMYTEPDGEFPNHPADPSKHATLKDLKERVQVERADLGLAFDGDGDRLGIVDSKGSILSADHILLLLAEDHLQRFPKYPVIFTVSNSSLLETEVAAWGGKPVMCKVGHSFVEHTMREHRALLGGEQSGHFFCSEEYFGFDDALVAALRVLKILQSRREPIHDLIAKYPKVFQAHEMRPACLDAKKADVVRRITEHFQEMYPLTTLDGARIDFGKGGWAGVRFSNTSPCLSICIEARSEEHCNAIEEEVMAHLQTYPEIDVSK